MQLDAIDATGLVGAEVQGTEPYDVWLLFDAHTRRVAVNCDCPVGDDYTRCKHAWAVLVTLAQQGLLDRLGPDASKWRSVFARLMFDDDPPGAVMDAMFWLDPDGEVTVTPTRGRAWTVDLARNRPFGNETPELTAVPAPELGWAERVERATRAATQPDFTALLRSESSHKPPREYFYGLWVIEHEPPRLGVTVHSRAAGSTGRRFRGESTTEALPWNAPPPAPADARALAAVRGAALADGDGYSWRYDSKKNPVTLEPALVPAVLEALCATGRCHLMGGGDTAPTSGPQIHWGGAQPWAVQLTLRGGPDDAELTLNAELARGDAVLGGPGREGAVVTREAVFHRLPDTDRLAISPLSGPDALPWLDLLGGTAATPVPADDAPALIARLFAQPGIPPLNLPDHLALGESQAPAAGVLRVMRPDPEARRPGGHVLAEVAFAYGDQVLSAGDPRRGVVDAEQRTAALRSAEQEQALLERATALGESRGRSVPGSADDDQDVPRDWVAYPPDQLGDVAATLTDEGWRVEADNRPLRVSKGDFTLSVSSGID